MVQRLWHDEVGLGFVVVVKLICLLWNLLEKNFDMLVLVIRGSYSHSLRDSLLNSLLSLLTAAAAAK